MGQAPPAALASCLVPVLRALPHLLQLYLADIKPSVMESNPEKKWFTLAQELRSSWNTVGVMLVVVQPHPAPLLMPLSIVAGHLGNLLTMHTPAADV